MLGELASSAQKETRALRDREIELRGKLASAESTYMQLTSTLDTAHSAARDYQQQLSEMEGATEDERARVADKIAALQRQLEAREALADQARAKVAEEQAKLRAVETEKAAEKARAEQYSLDLASLRSEEQIARRKEIFASLQRGSDLVAEISQIAEPFVPGAGTAGGIAAALAALIVGAVGGKKYLERKGASNA